MIGNKLVEDDCNSIAEIMRSAQDAGKNGSRSLQHRGRLSKMCYKVLSLWARKEEGIPPVISTSSNQQ